MFANAEKTSSSRSPHNRVRRLGCSILAHEGRARHFFLAEWQERLTSFAQLGVPYKFSPLRPSTLSALLTGMNP